MATVSHAYAQMSGKEICARKVSILIREGSGGEKYGEKILFYKLRGFIFNSENFVLRLVQVLIMRLALRFRC